ncbi:hypothetical protein CR513_58481, partial [Mucuna pruriens]
MFDIGSVIDESYDTKEQCKGAMENSVEIVIEKLLHVTKDIIPKSADLRETITFAQRNRSISSERAKH